MSRRDSRWKKEEHGDSAQNALCDHGAQSGNSQNSYPAAAIGSPCPDCENNGEQTYKFRHHAMAVLESNAAYHVRHLVERTERSRPIGNGETRIVAGDQGSGNDEHKRGRSREYSETVQRTIVPCGNGLQRRLPWVY